MVLAAAVPVLELYVLRDLLQSPYFEDRQSLPGVPPTRTHRRHFALSESFSRCQRADRPPSHRLARSVAS